MTLSFERTRSLALCAVVTLVSGCGGGGGTSAIPSTVAAAGAPIASTYAVPTDDWVTFAHDALRTGFQPQTTGISPTNVASLVPRWTSHLGFGIEASPLVANGRVYVAGHDGTVAALDVRTGSTLWTATQLGDVQMTPALADGLLFVGDHVQGGSLTALDAATGAVRWRSGPYAGGLRATPLVRNGTLYIGEAGGDPGDGGCHHSGVHALQEQTGAPLWTWYVNPSAGDGGAVWAPISSSGDGITFGTGNTCSLGVTTANSLVHLDDGGHLVWSQQAALAASDDDFGGAALLYAGRAIALDKTGTLYARDAATGAPVWSTRLNTLDGYGGFASPSTDGTTLVVGAGYVADPTHVAVPGGLLDGVDLSGNVLWTIHSSEPENGVVAITGGVGFTVLDGTYVALDIRSGTKLWSAPAGAPSLASPAVVPSGVYYANALGDVTAFALHAATSASIRRR